MKIITFLTLTLLLFSSCLKDRIAANGNIITETRILRTFKGVNLSGSKHIYISRGDEYKVKLRGSSNLISRYKTDVIGDELNLGYDTFKNIVDDDPLI